MASKPFFRRGQWLCSARVEPNRKAKQVRLGNHGAPYPPDKPPKRPPPYVIQAYARVVERERAVKSPFGPTVAAETDFASYVAAHVERFTRTHRGVSAGKTLRRLGKLVTAFAAERGVKTIQDAGKAFCRDFLESRVGLVSPNSIATEKGMLSPIWTRAVEDDLIPANPWAKVKVPGKRTEHVARTWTSPEVAAIVAACRKPWHANLVRVLANTGIRVSAVLAMRWDWIDWGAGVVTIPPEFDKAGKGYQIALTQGARNVLEPMHGLSKAELVFPTDAGRPFGYSAARDFFATAVKRSGVPKGSLHDLRHTFARHLIETAPVNVVQAALGHSSITMTNRYVRLTGANTAKFVGGFEIGEGEKGTGKANDHDRAGGPRREGATPTVDHVVPTTARTREVERAQRQLEAIAYHQAGEWEALVRRANEIDVERGQGAVSDEVGDEVDETHDPTVEAMREAGVQGVVVGRKLVIDSWHGDGIPGDWAGRSLVVIDLDKVRGL